MLIIAFISYDEQSFYYYLLLFYFDSVMVYLIVNMV